MNRMLRYLRFNLVGGMGMVVQLGAVWMATRVLPEHYVLTSALAVELAVVHNFAWHMRYTWRDRAVDTRWLKRLVKFQLSNGAVSLTGNLLLIPLLVIHAGLPVFVANLVAIACCSFLNFLVSDAWTFQKRVVEEC